VSVITSLQNERVKLVRALQTSVKTRRKESRIVLEGVRLIGDALAAGVQPDFVFYTAGDQHDSRLFAGLLSKLETRNVPNFEISDEVMAHITDTDTPQGVLAVVPEPNFALPSTITLVLILDAVADPGNLGTILRTSAAAGVDAVVLAPGCVDPFNPKVLRSAMGAHFRVPILRLSWTEIAAQYQTLQVAVADADGDTVYYKADWTKPSVIVIGGEARGADQSARELADTIISIPMEKGSESLNAAMAAGIILFECRRQRTNL
jgi:RNA methyltransferase, TrmH family